VFVTEVGIVGGLHFVRPIELSFGIELPDDHVQDRGMVPVRTAVFIEWNNPHASLDVLGAMDLD
jgi:hypothetical protein